MRPPLRVLHVTSALETGGVNVMLEQLVRQGGSHDAQSEVVSLLDEGNIGRRLVSRGVPVRALHMGRRIPNLTRVATLAAHVRRCRPDVVQTWTYHGDVVGGIAAWLGRVPVVWGVHHARLDGDLTARTRLVVRACAQLSWLPRRIVCVSEVGRQAHAALGYRAAKLVTIHNGVDTHRFTPDPSARHWLRSELHLAPGAFVIGAVARDHPHKGIGHLLVAAQQFLEKRQAHFVICGTGLDESNQALMREVQRNQLGDRLHLLGHRGDVNKIVAGLDVFTSASEEEAFPIALIEAMACGVPCVATDVGDSAFIVGSAGRIVSPRNPSALANAWLALSRMTGTERLDVGRAARDRIVDRFDIRSIASHYYRLYREVTN